MHGHEIQDTACIIYDTRRSCFWQGFSNYQGDCNVAIFAEMTLKKTFT